MDWHLFRDLDKAFCWTVKWHRVWEGARAVAIFRPGDVRVRAAHPEEGVRDFWSPSAKPRQADPQGDLGAPDSEQPSDDSGGTSESCSGCSGDDSEDHDKSSSSGCDAEDGASDVDEEDRCIRVSAIRGRTLKRQSGLSLSGMSVYLSFHSHWSLE